VLDFYQHILLDDPSFRHKWNLAKPKQKERIWIPIDAIPLLREELAELCCTHCGVRYRDHARADHLFDWLDTDDSTDETD